MIVSALLAATMAAQPPSTAATEILGIDVPDEFQVGNHQRNEEAEIIEIVDPPETVDNWSKLITTLMFFDAARSGLDAFYGRWRDRLRDGCPGITDNVVHGSIDGHPALRATISCPNNPQTGKPQRT